MDKNILRTITIALLIAGLVFLIYKLASTEEETYFKQVELSKKNKITNRTSHNYLDTIVSVGLDKLAIENINVLILPLNSAQKKMLGPDLEITAHVRAVGNFYYIWIDNLPKDQAVSVLSHEIIHIHQYYTGRISFDETNVIWNKVTYDLYETPYDQRPWENEAFILQEVLKSSIESELY